MGLGMDLPATATATATATGYTITYNTLYRSAHLTDTNPSRTTRS